MSGPPASALASSSEESADLIWMEQDDEGLARQSSRSAVPQQGTAEDIAPLTMCPAAAGALQGLSKAIDKLAQEAALCLKDHQEVSAMIWNELMVQAEEHNALQDRLAGKVAAVQRRATSQIAAAQAMTAGQITQADGEELGLEISLRVDTDAEDEEEEGEIDGAILGIASAASDGTQGSRSGADSEQAHRRTPAGPKVTIAAKIGEELQAAEAAIAAEAQAEQVLHQGVASMLENMRCRIRSAVHTERVARERSEEELFRAIESSLSTPGADQA